MNGFLIASLALGAPTTSLPTTSDVLQGEMAALAPLLGTWEVNATWASGQSIWSRAVYEIGIAGRTIEGRVFVSDGGGEAYQRYSSVFAFDAERQQFVAHTFEKDGSYSAQDFEFEGNVLRMEWTENGALIRDESDLLAAGLMEWSVGVKAPGAIEFQPLIDATWNRPAPGVRSIDVSRFDGSGPQVRSFVKQTTIDAPLESVFAAWSDGEAFARSYDLKRSELRTNIELAIGGPYEWLWDEKEGSNGCQVLSYIPKRMISISWNAPPASPRAAPDTPGWWSTSPKPQRARG
ncbi:MAG: hypothetical protein ACI8QZ_002039 [Chlamydiales bacterium]|jgi:hypothetical protein